MWLICMYSPSLVYYIGCIALHHLRRGKKTLHYLHTSILATLFVVECDEFTSSRLMIYGIIIGIAIEASVVANKFELLFTVQYY